MSIDFETAAARFYGASNSPNAPPAQTTAPADAHDDVQRTAERLFGAGQASSAQRDARPVEALSEDEVADRLFGGTDPTLTHADATQAIVNAAMQVALADPESAGEIAAEYAATFAEHRLSATDSKDVADIGIGAMKSPPTPELVASWTEKAIETLQAEYGVQGAGQALDDARRYVASHPGLPDLLDALGLGSHPKLVALAAARGRAMRMAGKLR